MKQMLYHQATTAGCICNLTGQSGSERFYSIWIHLYKKTRPCWDSNPRAYQLAVSKSKCYQLSYPGWILLSTSLYYHLLQARHRSKQESKWLNWVIKIFKGKTFTAEFYCPNFSIIKHVAQNWVAKIWRQKILGWWGWWTPILCQVGVVNAYSLSGGSGSAICKNDQTM